MIAHGAAESRRRQSQSAICRSETVSQSVSQPFRARQSRSEYLSDSVTVRISVATNPNCYSEKLKDKGEKEAPLLFCRKNTDETWENLY